MLLSLVPSTRWLQKQATVPSRQGHSLLVTHSVSLTYQSILPSLGQLRSLLLGAITLGFHLAGASDPLPSLWAPSLSPPPEHPGVHPVSSASAAA